MIIPRDDVHTTLIRQVLVLVPLIQDVREPVMLTGLPQDQLQWGWPVSPVRST